MIKVFIVDDHTSIIDSFSQVINNQKDMEFVGGTSDCSEVISLCAKVSPDIVLTDISMDKANSGIILTEKLKYEFPDIKVIVMSGFDEISYIPNAKKAGADAFLSKSKSLEEFIEMTRKTIEGKGEFPQEISIPTAKGEAPFTLRELEMLTLLCHSYSRKEIAEHMNIAEGTVKRHIENMLVKSGCKSTMELVVYVVSNGWISPK